MCVEAASSWLAGVSLSAEVKTLETGVFQELSYFLKQVPVGVTRLHGLCFLSSAHRLSVNMIKLLLKPDCWFYWLSAAITGRPCLLQMMLLVTVGAAQHRRSWRSLQFTEEKQCDYLSWSKWSSEFCITRAKVAPSLLPLMSEQSRQPVKRLRWVKGFCDSITADENRRNLPLICTENIAAFL